MLEKRVFRRIFGPKRDETSGSWKKHIMCYLIIFAPRYILQGLRKIGWRVYLERLNSKRTKRKELLFGGRIILSFVLRIQCPKTWITLMRLRFWSIVEHVNEYSGSNTAAYQEDLCRWQWLCSYLNLTQCPCHQINTSVFHSCIKPNRRVIPVFRTGTQVLWWRVE
jgi:hypothetical protein